MADSVRSYTVAWIAALAHERAAGEAMFDDERDDPPPDFHKSAGDINEYSWGRVGKHNVVIASLPAGEYGLVSAATVAQALSSSLPHIRVGLLVGIGAGIPGEKQDENGVITVERDIRLGDVVVSSPDRTNGGVVQLDLVKAKEVDGKQVLERKGFLNSPPIALRSALSKLQARHEKKDPKIASLMESAFTKYPKMSRTYSHPRCGLEGTNQDADIYFSQSGQQIERDTREQPEVHYGTIASGNILEKSANHREMVLSRLRTENIYPLCIEMEAAGLMNSFPCLVIRGICDYADEHKNDKWQRYAAATAAGFAKELLECVDPSQVEGTPELQHVLDQLDSIDQKIGDINVNASAIRYYIDDEKFHAALQWICNVDYSTILGDHRDQIQPGSGQWFIDHSEFQAWKAHQDARILICQGAPGTGKTILATIAANHLEKGSGGDDEIVICLYCDYKRRSEQTLLHFMKSALRQLLCTKSSAPIAMQLQDKHKKQRTNLGLQETTEMVEEIMSKFSQVWIIVDALDECDPQIQELFIRTLLALATQANTAIMLTSRPLTTIQELFPSALAIEIVASEDDVKRYAESRIQKDFATFVRNKPDLMSRIAQGVAQAADGRFLLARLHVDSLKTKPTERIMLDAVKALPKALTTESEVYDPAYEDAMKRVFSQPEDYRKIAKLVFSWVVQAQQLLTSLELEHALTVIVGERDLDSTNRHNVDFCLGYCAGLVVREYESNTIRLVHETTQDYLFRTRSRWIPDCSLDLARICITYLSFDSFLPGVEVATSELNKKLDEYPLLDYAGQYWGVHAKDVEDSKDHSKVTELHQLLRGLFQSTSKVEFIFQMLFESQYYSSDGEIRLQRTISHLLAHFGLVQFFREELTTQDRRSKSENRNNREVSDAVQVSLDIKDEAGMTPLSYAASRGHDATVRMLIDTEQVDIDSKDIDGRTPLSWAASRGHNAIMKILLDTKQVEVDSKDMGGRTPLSYAASRGNDTIMKILLDTKQVKVDSKDTDGMTPLSWAASRGHNAIMKILLDTKQVEVDSKNTNGRTPLSYAASGGHDTIVKMLLDTKQVDINSKNIHGRTPLSYAASGGHDTIVKMLLDTKQVDINSKNIHGRTPLWWAATKGHVIIVKMLLDTKQVKVDSKDNYGETPLSRAVLRRRDTVVKMLLDIGQAGVDSRDENGNTPLQ